MGLPGETSLTQLIEGQQLVYGGNRFTVVSVDLARSFRAGDRLVIVSTLVKFRRGAIIVSRFQGFVRESLACEGQIKGIALPVDALKKKLDVAT
jgi:hypothetical protein